MQIMKQTMLARLTPQTQSELRPLPVFAPFFEMKSFRFMIVGPAGCGKTTFAKVLARDYHGTITRDNVLIINSLEGQGTTYFRNDLKTFCQTACSIAARSKIVLVEDIDLMVETGQQTFMSSMDNYGSKVHFIATCTVSTKLIENMHSRFMFYKLPPFTPEFLTELFVSIAGNEKLAYDAACVPVIVARNPSIRALINTVEKLLLIGRFVDKALVDSTCTIIHNDVFELFTQHVLHKRLPEAMRTLNGIYRDGYSVMDILDCYFSFLKGTAIVTTEVKFNYIKVLCKYIAILNTLHEHPIELCFFVFDLIYTNLK